MTITVAVVAPGNMGAGVARRLAEHQVRVLTTLDGRGAASAARAHEAGMVAVPFDRLVEAQLVLSIVPPASAVSLAKHLAPALTAERKARGSSDGGPVFVDCNAVNPETVQEIAAIITATGTPFVDAAIIGQPPKPGAPGPHFYASGAEAARFKLLGDYGLDIRVLDGPVGAASALKMCYAGINKGLAAIGAAMIIAASRSGATAALYQEMSESLPNVLQSLRRQIPDMLPKAYRWVGEMHEIAEFVDDDPAARDIFNGLARLFDQIAQDVGAQRRESATLTDFFAQKSPLP